MRFEYWQSLKDEKWYFHLKSGNGEIVMQSQSYTSPASLKDTITSIKIGVPNATVGLAESL